MKKSQHFSFPWWWGITSCYEIQSACKTLNVLKWSTSVSFHFITIVLKSSEIKHKIKKPSKTQLHEIIPNLFRWDKRVVRCSAKPEKRRMKMNCSSFAVFLPQSQHHAQHLCSCNPQKMRRGLSLNVFTK